MKRLAKLQASSTSASASPSTSSPAPPPPAPSPKPKARPPPPTPKPVEASTPQTHVPPRKKAHIAPSFYYDVWENETIGEVFLVTLDVRLLSLGSFACGVDELSGVGSLQKR